MTELRLAVSAELSTTSERTVTGYAYTSDVVVEHEGMTFKFAPDSVRPWRDHMPAYAFHNDNDPVGKLSASEWDGTGWKVSLKLAKTPRGDELLVLADEGVIGGLSMYLSDVEFDESGEVPIVTSAQCREISLVSHPAVPTAVLTGVALSATPPTKEKDKKMTENPVAEQAGAELELSSPQGPAVHPIPLISRRADNENPYPHLYGGPQGEHSLFKDMRLSETNEGAAERLQSLLHYDRNRKLSIMRLAVTTANLPVTDPPINQSLYWDEIADPGNPLTDLANTGTISTSNPFYVPSYDSTAEATLSAPHVEGVEPALGSLGTFHRALVTPSAVSGKIALTREAVDFSDSNPQMEALAFRRMDVARRRAQEAALVTYLNGLTLAAGNVIPISRANAVGDVINVLAGMAYRADGSRFTRLIASQGTFGDLVGQKDTTGRHMLPIIQPTNAMGSTADSVQSVYIGSTLVRPVQGLGTTNSYLYDPSEMWVWNSRVLNLRMDYEVAWVRLGHFALQAQHVIDKGGIIRLTRSAT